MHTQTPSQTYAPLRNAFAARVLAALAVAACAHGSPARAGELVQLATRTGVTQRVFVSAPAAPPPWIAVLFAGDDGNVALSSGGPARMQGNFVVRTASYWVDHGEGSAIFDAPSDNADGMRDDFRLGADASTDVAQVVAELRRRYPGARIALVGTSRGTITVGNLIKRRPDLADAFVMTSPVTQESRGQPGLSGMAWDGNKARVLVVSNEHDGCQVSPFDSARQLAAKNGFDFIAVASSQGGGDRKSDCKAQSPHGFLGIEQTVLDDIRGWLDKAPAPR